MKLPHARSRFLIFAAVAAFATSSPSFAIRTCISPGKAAQHANHDVCVAAHVYRVIDGGSGVHFLDVCSPQTSDADCHFFILSFDRDTKSTGDLKSLVNRDIHIRGTVHLIEDRAEIVFSNRRQLHGGPGEFHPNPKLIASFSAQNGGQGFRARNGVMGQRGVHFHHRGR